MNQQEYEVQLSAPVNPGDNVMAANLVRRVIGYWNAAGGPNSREDILNDLIRIGYRPEVASNAVYSQLTEQTAQALQTGGDVLGAQDDSPLPPAPPGSPGEEEEPAYTPEQLYAALQAYNAQVKTINSAYGAGLLSFTQQQKLLNQNTQDIKTDLSNQQQANSAYFSNVSPDAFQSQQGVYGQKILDEYKRAEGLIQDQQTELTESKANFEQQQQDALEAAGTNYNFQFGPYADNVEPGALAPTYTGGASTVAPTFNPATLSQSGARLTGESPNRPSRFSPNYKPKGQEDDALSRYLNA